MEIAINKSPTKTDLMKIFNALGDKTRFKLVEIMSEEADICVSELAERIGISTAGASQQLRLLQNAGIIKPIRNGRKTCYCLDNSNPQVKKVVGLLANGK